MTLLFQEENVKNVKIVRKTQIFHAGDWWRMKNRQHHTTHARITIIHSFAVGRMASQQVTYKDKTE